MPKQKPPIWSYSAGGGGVHISVFERQPGGVLYARAPNGRGGYLRVSLGHRDRDRAIAYAHEQTAKLKQGTDDLRAGRITVSHLFAAYLAHRTPRKALSEQLEDKRRSDLWGRFLGASKEARSITRGEWERFEDLRATGAIAPDGSAVTPDKRRPVRTRTVQSDLQWLRWVLGWATTWQDVEGKYLLAQNPVRGFPMPSEKNPRRPLATTDRLEKVLEAAEQLVMELRWGGKARRQRAYLADILTIAAGTGRRVSAILALRFEDVLWEAKPHGALRWRAENDKMGRESTAPVTPAVRAALERIKTERPGLGGALLFPSPTNPAQPVSYERVRHWLIKAEQAAKVPKQAGGLFHPYRRAWATARKGMSIKDVAAAGGWKSEAVLLRHYQQPDDETMLAVVLGGAELREQKA
jgi:integrase